MMDDGAKWVLKTVEAERQKNGDEAAEEMLKEWQTMQLLTHIIDVTRTILIQREIAALQDQIDRLRGGRAKSHEHLSALGDAMPENFVDKAVRGFLQSDQAKGLTLHRLDLQDFQKLFQEYVRSTLGTVDDDNNKE